MDSVWEEVVLGFSVISFLTAIPAIVTEVPFTVTEAMEAQVTAKALEALVTVEEVLEDPVTMEGVSRALFTVAIVLKASVTVVEVFLEVPVSVAIVLEVPVTVEVVSKARVTVAMVLEDQITEAMVLEALNTVAVGAMTFSPVYMIEKPILKIRKKVPLNFASFSYYTLNQVILRDFNIVMALVL